MPKPFYITTAIDYTNGVPHIGHAYEKVLADVLARYHRLRGDEVYFLTGVDQHGQKVQQSAEKAGVPPQQFVDEITAKFIALWEKLEVRYDGWAATTDPVHKRCVQGMLQRLYDEGQIYKDKQDGYYSIRQEQFLTDKERGPDGEFGPEWGEVEHRTEENYYFRLAAHKEWLLGYLRAHPDCVTPDYRQTELVNAVEKLSGDLCISRPKTRLSWGIALPFDTDYVNYVWFDALTNYISFIGYDPREKEWEKQPNEFRKLWPALHVIGKDILIPAHGIYWPIMLRALGFPDEQMPKFLVHGWWNISGAKMSKSLGNVIDPNELADKYGPEALRYYLTSDIVVGKDADFSEDRLIERYNSELANSLGNLLNRTLSMAARYLEGKLRRGQPPALDLAVERPGRAIQLATEANQQIEQTAPWKLMKEGQAETVAGILYDLAERLRIIAILISPVLPHAAHGIFDQLNWKLEPELAGKEERFSLADAEWGKLPDAHVVGAPIPLFPRIETVE
ncbi:MAG: class I tRNA ligase family protein [Chthoniobacterales bacterium]